jgi:hypothetical protein
MTSSRPKTTLQDELLADLRVAAPIPVTPPKTATPKTATPKTGAPEPEAPQAPAADTPTVSLRVTPWHWARPSLHHVPGERPTLRVGPLHLSVTGFAQRNR